MNWISVGDGLPENLQKVLVFGGYPNMKYQDVAEFQRSNQKYRFKDSSDGCSFTKVTHWQPLPEPPKED